MSFLPGSSAFHLAQTAQLPPRALETSARRTAREDAREAVAASMSAGAQAATLAEDESRAWYACETLAEILESGTLDWTEADLQDFRDMLSTERFQRALAAALGRPEANFVAVGHEGFRERLLERTTNANQAGAGRDLVPSQQDVLAVRKLATMLSVQDASGDLRARSATESACSAELVRWAMNADVPDGPFRRHLVWEWLQGHHLGSAALGARLPAQLRCRQRLDQAALLQTVERLSAPGQRESTCNSRRLNQRLLAVMDKVMGNEALALLCGACTRRESIDSEASARAHLGKLEQIVSVHEALVEGRPSFAAAWGNFADDLRAGAGFPSEEAAPQAVSPLPWSAVWGLFTPRRGRPDASCAPLSRLALTEAWTPSPSDQSRRALEDSAAPPADPPSSRPSSVARSVEARRWSMSHWESPRSAPRSGLSETSLDWVGTCEPERAGERHANGASLLTGARFKAGEAITLWRLLANADGLPLNAVARQWRQSAMSVMAAGDVGDGSGEVSVGPEALAIVEGAVLRLTSLAFDRVSAPREGAVSPLRERPAQALAALSRLAAWADAASGREAASRAAWFDLLVDRTLRPASTITVPAAMVGKDESLPPWSEVRRLLGPQSASETGTLAWNGERIASAGPLSRLLERLGVRHLHLPLSAIREEGLPEALQLDCVSAATVRFDSGYDKRRLKSALSVLSQAMRSLYQVRTMSPAGHPVALPTYMLPAEWDHLKDDPSAGLVQIHRDVCRQALEPLRSLWPERRMPLALRSASLNPQAGGLVVFEFLRNLRAQREGHASLRDSDPEMCLRLSNVIEGLHVDAAFARRCNEMLDDPLGPCSDAGMMMLSAMSSLRDTAEAKSPAEVAAAAFLQACMVRADNQRVARSQSHFETLEDAMVLHWFMTAQLRDLLGSDHIRVSPKPLFGFYNEGADWDTAERRDAFVAEALAMIRDEVREDFPVLQVVLEHEGHMGDAFRERLDAGPVFEALDARMAAANADYERDMDDDADMDAVVAKFQQIREGLARERREARMAVLQPHLRAVARRVLGDEGEAGPSGEPPAKRAK